MDESERTLRATIARRVTVVTALAVGVSVLLTSMVRLLLGDAPDEISASLLIAVLVPALVAPLGSWRVIALSERLRLANENQRLANERLRLANEDLRLANDALRTLSETDPLTQTLNRRRFFEVFSQQLALAARHCYPTTLLLIDFDHFKQINDRFGHVVGDQVLVESTRLMREICRESDALARFGGEEFVMLLPHTARDGAERFAARIMQRMNEVVIHDPASGLPMVGLAVSVSIGGVTSEASEADVDFMMSRADALLYVAKQAGRDRCVIETLPGQPELGFDIAGDR